MESNLVLTKESSNQQIKDYFDGILLLAKSNEEFPINLDEVWMLVYGKKSDAVEALSQNFIQDVDYQVLRKNPQNPNGGRPINEYHLSVSCMEYFIARKVRAVFEVYRKVFHKAVQQYQVPQTFAEALMLAAKQQEQIEEQNQLLLAQGNQITEMQDAITEMLPKVSYCDKILQSKSTVCITQIAQDYGYSAKKFNILLRNFKLQRKVGNQWVLYSPHNTKGYVQSESFIPENSTSGKVVMTSKWTQRGRLFLYEFLKERGVLPLIEQDLEQNHQASEPIKALAC